MLEINENTYILSIVTEFPQTIPVFLKYGVQCIGCKNADQETVANAARCNGIVNVNKFLNELILVSKLEHREEETAIKRVFNCRKEQNSNESEDPFK